MKYIILVLFAVFVSSCSSPQEKEKPFIVKVKSLEFSRDNNLLHWKSLYRNAKGKEKIVVLNSMAMTKKSVFIPFVDSILTNERDRELREKAIFALGQSGSEKSESILLQTFTSKLPLSTKNKIIQALAHCGTDRAVPHLQSWLNDAELKGYVVKTAGILARKKVNLKAFRKTVLSDSIAGCGYFLYNYYQRRDFNRVVEWLNIAKGAEQKYLLQWLLKDYKKRGRYFEKSALNDTVFTETLKTILTKEKDWRNQYYAISLIPAINDSSKELLLERFIKSKNPHLRLKSYVVMAKINNSRIPEFLRNEKSWALKGELLKLLAKSQSGVAYGMIMENLDQGTDYFKIKLLQALNIINDRMSRQTIKQFLNVDNPRLTNASFDILKKRGRINSDDIEMLLNSDAVSTAASVIEWQTARKKTLKSDMLLSLYSKYKAPKSFDLQSEILKNLKLKKGIPAEKEIKLLYKHAANRQIVENLNQWFSLNNDTLSTFVLPAFLSPDSIMNADERAIVYIKTVKGIIKAELYQHEAPLTVFNFLSLVKKGFYDGLKFHRVVADFVVQGGDPLGDGWGGPGYFIPSEDNELSFKRGSIGMATSGFDSGGSQFFICQSAQPHLDGNYTLFGDVIAGMDVVDELLPDDKIINITVRKE